MGAMFSRGGVVDPWDYQEPASFPPGEVRTIVVTDAMRAADAAERAIRERPEHAWSAVKASLSEANLGGRVVRAEAARGRAAGTRGVVTGRPAPLKRRCTQCDALLGRVSNATMCKACRPKRVRPPRGRRCPACASRMHHAAPIDAVCIRCRGGERAYVVEQRAAKAAPAATARREDVTPVRSAKTLEASGVAPQRMCSRGCGRRLYAKNAGDVCGRCAQARKPTPVCAAGCGRMVSPLSKHAVCLRCRRPERAARVCSTVGCGNGLGPNNKRGTCFACEGERKRHAQTVSAAMDPKQCVAGCGRWLSVGLRRRADDLCKDCGASADEKAIRGCVARLARRCGRARRRSCG
jgi:hypothetical protein